MIYVFDFEVFANDWLVVFKDISSGRYTVIHNDNHAVKQFVTADKLLAGFNCKFYDNHILKAVLCGADNALVKEINDYIVQDGKLGFTHWFLKENQAFFNTFDIRDDIQQGLSLKAIEGHFGMNIEESSVPFDIDRPLTKQELEEVIRYCKHDVDTIEKLIKIRKPYLEGKLALGRMKGLPDATSLYATNAKLTALFLDAKATEWTDERNYKYPANLKKELIPPEVIAFFDRMHDPTISDTELFNSKLDIDIGNGLIATYGYGGIHAGLKNYQEQRSPKRVIRNYDVASLYPSLMIRCGYISRNIPFAEYFKKVYWDRIAAKKEGDKKTANTLKLCLNTCYGAMLNPYNDLYDPLMGRSVCISGQLFLTELVMAYLRECKTIRIINFNTDGVMFSINREEMSKIYDINREWQNRTGFELEEDEIAKIVQKDVNNYCLIKENGTVKIKGGYLTYGISEAGAWNINNNATVVKKALIEYFTKGTPIEQTITENNNVLDYQFIAKAGSKYKSVYHMVNGEKVPVQKVNRVYASKDPTLGTLYKIHAETGRPAKIEELPEHCVIDNRNELTIDDIDKSFYIAMAKKRLDDYLGVKPPKIDKRKLNTLKKQVLKLLEA